VFLISYIVVDCGIDFVNLYIFFTCNPLTIIITRRVPVTVQTREVRAAMKRYALKVCGDVDDLVTASGPVVDDDDTRFSIGCTVSATTK
jgi:hypothetical protein